MSLVNRFIEGTTSNNNKYEIAIQTNGDISESFTRIFYVKIDGVVREDIKSTLQTLSEKQICLKIEHLLSPASS